MKMSRESFCVDHSRLPAQKQGDPSTCQIQVLLILSICRGARVDALFGDGGFKTESGTGIGVASLPWKRW